MIYLLLPLIFLNLHLGFILFCTQKRIKIKKPTASELFQFYALAIGLTALSSVVFSTKVSVCIPLLIGFFYFFKTSVAGFKSKSEKLNSIIIVCEMTLIYLKTGRSFDESLRLSFAKTDMDFLNLKKDKKNVVMQQPKSRNLCLFEEFQLDLHHISKVRLGKLELLESTKTKYDTFLSLKQKTKTATTQYRAQSSTLIALWLLSLTSLIWQNKVFLYKNIIILSFLMMIAGLVLSRFILIKTEFRI